MLAIREIRAPAKAGRLDLFLTQQGLGLNRSGIRRLIDEGNVLVNGTFPKAGQRLRSGDRLVVTIPEPKPLELEAEEMPLRIVFQDRDLLVVDKPAGLAVHPGPGHPAGTLVNGLLAICTDLSGIGGRLRPGIVHRLDKDTSGLMVVAKTESAHLAISQQLKERRVAKGYLALVQGKLTPEQGTIEGPIGRHPVDRKRMAVVPGGREAATAYRVLCCLERTSFLEVSPLTGRTHQIRVHLAHLGHPLVGDSVYGKKETTLGRHFLHAHRLAFLHPTEGKTVEFTSPLPLDLQRTLASFGG